MKIYKRFFYLLFFIVLNIQIYPKSALFNNTTIWGECHIHDQMLLLGLYNGNSEKNINQTNKNYEIIKDVLIQFNYWIDDQYKEGENKRFYYELQQKYKINKSKFSWHKYTHRLLFHWGYDWGDPVGHYALKKAFFNLEEIDENKLSPEEKQMFDNFLYDIQKEQAKREAQMTDLIGNFFNSKGSRDFNHSIGALIYYTHLIGDHIQTANSYTDEAVLSTEQIMIKIKKEIDRLVGNETLRAKVSNELEMFNQEWKKLKNSGKNGSILAQGVIDVLAQYLSPILDKLWGNTFRNTGLQFVYK